MSEARNVGEARGGTSNRNATANPDSDAELRAHQQPVGEARGGTSNRTLEDSVVGDGGGLRTVGFLAGLVVVIVGGVVTRILTENAPVWTEGTAVADFVEAIEYPVYAIALGLLLNALLAATGLRDRLAPGFRTEFFIKTGLVVLGATVVLSVIVRAAGPAVIQGLLLITGVFAFTWWLGGRMELDDRLRALLASAVAICGVSAAIAAAGAVRARREQLAYTASLVIIFALPSIFILPWLAGILGLSDAVTGAWLGGNIDTTAAVTAAGTIAGEDVLQIASVVKLTQNALIGFVAIGLTAWFAFKVDRTGDSERPKAIELWRRFPKFVLGFLAASVIATIFAESASAEAVDSFETVVKGFRDYFLILAFVSIGLEFKVTSLREAGVRPIGLFAAATLFNVALALGLALLLFSGFSI